MHDTVTLAGLAGSTVYILGHAHMVESGMPPMAAIQAATVESARLLGMEDQLGTVDAGKLADLIAVEGDPIANIPQMTKVVFVMKAGRVYSTQR